MKRYDGDTQSRFDISLRRTAGLAIQNGSLSSQIGSDIKSLNPSIYTGGVFSDDSYDSSKIPLLMVQSQSTEINLDSSSRILEKVTKNMYLRHKSQLKAQNQRMKSSPLIIQSMKVVNFHDLANDYPITSTAKNKHKMKKKEKFALNQQYLNDGNDNKSMSSAKSHGMHSISSSKRSLDGEESVELRELSTNLLGSQYPILLPPLSKVNKIPSLKNLAITAGASIPIRTHQIDYNSTEIESKIQPENGNFGVTIRLRSPVSRTADSFLKSPNALNNRIRNDEVGITQKPLSRQYHNGIKGLVMRKSGIEIIAPTLADSPLKAIQSVPAYLKDETAKNNSKIIQSFNSRTTHVDSGSLITNYNQIPSNHPEGTSPFHGGRSSSLMIPSKSAPILKLQNDLSSPYQTVPHDLPHTPVHAKIPSSAGMNIIQVTNDSIDENFNSAESWQTEIISNDFNVVTEPDKPTSDVFGMDDDTLDKESRPVSRSDQRVSNKEEEDEYRQSSSARVEIDDEEDHNVEYQPFEQEPRPFSNHDMNVSTAHMPDPFLDQTGQHPWEREADEANVTLLNALQNEFIGQTRENDFQISPSSSPSRHDLTKSDDNSISSQHSSKVIAIAQSILNQANTNAQQILAPRKTKETETVGYFQRKEKETTPQFIMQSTSALSNSSDFPGTETAPFATRSKTSHEGSSPKSNRINIKDVEGVGLSTEGEIILRMHSNESINSIPGLGFKPNHSRVSLASTSMTSSKSSDLFHKQIGKKSVVFEGDDKLNTPVVDVVQRNDRIVEDVEDVEEDMHQAPYQVHKRIMGWKLTNTVRRRKDLIGLLDIVHNIHPRDLMSSSHIRNSYPFQNVKETVNPTSGGKHLSALSHLKYDRNRKQEVGSHLKRLNQRVKLTEEARRIRAQNTLGAYKLDPVYVIESGADAESAGSTHWSDSQDATVEYYKEFHRSHSEEGLQLADDQLPSSSGKPHTASIPDFKTLVQIYQDVPKPDAVPQIEGVDKVDVQEATLVLENIRHRRETHNNSPPRQRYNALHHAQVSSLGGSNSRKTPDNEYSKWDRSGMVGVPYREVYNSRKGLRREADSQNHSGTIGSMPSNKNKMPPLQLVKTRLMPLNEQEKLLLNKMLQSYSSVADHVKGSSETDKNPRLALATITGTPMVVANIERQSAAWEKAVNRLVTARVSYQSVQAIRNLIEERLRHKKRMAERSWMKKMRHQQYLKIKESMPRKGDMPRSLVFSSEELAGLNYFDPNEDSEEDENRDLEDDDDGLDEDNGDDHLLVPSFEDDEYSNATQTLAMEVAHAYLHESHWKNAYDYGNTASKLSRRRERCITTPSALIAAATAASAMSQSNESYWQDSLKYHAITSGLHERSTSPTLSPSRVSPPPSRLGQSFEIHPSTTPSVVHQSALLESTALLPSFHTASVTLEPKQKAVLKSSQMEKHHRQDQLQRSTFDYPTNILRTRDRQDILQAVSMRAMMDANQLLRQRGNEIIAKYLEKKYGIQGSMSHQLIKMQTAQQETSASSSSNKKVDTTQNETVDRKPKQRSQSIVDWLDFPVVYPKGGRDHHALKSNSFIFEEKEFEDETADIETMEESSSLEKDPGGEEEEVVEIQPMQEEEEVVVEMIGLRPSEIIHQIVARPIPSSIVAKDHDDDEEKEETVEEDDQVQPTESFIEFETESLSSIGEDSSIV